MKLISNWSILGISVGLIFSIGTFVRYYIIYPDFSEVVIGVSIGVLIVAVSVFYNWLRGLENRLYAVEDYLAERGKE